MADTQEIAFITSMCVIAFLWSLLGYWFATNLLLSRHLTTNITWTLFLIIWLIATIIFLSLIIRSRFHGNASHQEIPVQHPAVRAHPHTKIISNIMLSHASEIKAVVNEIKHYELLITISQYVSDVGQGQPRLQF